MRVVVNSSGEYRDMINSYYDLERLDDGSDSEVLFQGYSTSRDATLKRVYKDYKKRVYLNLEAPCSFTSTASSVEEQGYFTHVYSICPYTCDWLNGMQSTEHTPIPFPFSKDFMVDTNVEKEYDVMYMGAVLNGEHRNIIDVMKNFNYIHTSLRSKDRPTHTNINSKRKLDLLARSKVSVAMNLAPITNKHIRMITKYKGWEGNEAFSELSEHYIPQFKPRVIESMICKTLVLVKRDWWNVIERWFGAGEHFIYWDDIDDLSGKIKDVVENYDKYADIVDRAYERVMDYEINKIYESIICKG